MSWFGGVRKPVGGGGWERESRGGVGRVQAQAGMLRVGGRGRDV